MPVMAKKMVSIRLTDDARRILSEQADRRGLSRPAFLEMLLRTVERRQHRRKVT